MSACWARAEPGDRIVVTVEGLRTDPAVLERLIDFAGLSPLAHSELPVLTQGLPPLTPPRTDELPDDISELYGMLLAEAGLAATSKRRLRGENLAPGGPNGTSADPAGTAALESRLTSVEAALRAEIAGVESRLVRLLEDLHDNLDRVRRSEGRTGTGEYEDVVRRVRRAVRERCPSAPRWPWSAGATTR